MENNAMDLTEGRPITKILLFSVPLVLGTLFQQLYSFMDTIMVGRFLGTNALAAVGSTYSLNFLILGFAQGSCIGFAVPLGRAVGAKDPKEFKRSFWNACWLCIVTFLVLTVLMLIFTVPLLRLIQTPEDIFSDAVTYVRIIFIGLGATTFYNYMAAVLRASGDSTRPFIFLVITSFLNIAFDYIFMALLHMGVAGAAVATVLSQFLSGFLCLWWIVNKTELLNESKDLRGLSASHLKELVVIGYPMGFEYCVSAVGAVIMQSAINSFGTVVVAGQTAGERIRQMFTLPMESVGMAMVTYVSQNDGAHRMDRIRQGIRAGLTIQWTYCVIAWVVIFFGKSFFTGIVLGTTTSAEAAYSVEYLTVISIFFCLHGALMIFRNTLQGMGYSLNAIISGVGELLGRTLGGWLAVRFLGYMGICLANPLAWGFALCYCTITVIHYIRKREA